MNVLTTMPKRDTVRIAPVRATATTKPLLQRSPRIALAPVQHALAISKAKTEKFRGSSRLASPARNS
jgi:hypothetical protein